MITKKSAKTTTRAKTSTKATPTRSAKKTAAPKIENILAIDIGGTGLKAAIVDAQGHMLTERVRVSTPHPCPPALLVDTLHTLVAPLVDQYSPARVSIGFPGFVRNNHVLTAPHLGLQGWSDVPLAQMLGERLGIDSVRMINDAEMQGFAAIEGHGLEFVLTLGTGAGTALFRDGELMPHLELAHHPVSKKHAYDEYIGDAARRKAGNKRWNRRVEKVIGILESLVHYDRLWIGGGNAERLAFDLPPNVATVPNDRGIEGGARLWHPLSIRETRQLPEATQKSGAFS
ncbi:polyphosphate glucokinase [Paraburkholderia bannensis]|uniref:Polyphosphate glucokinase n=1 Tax=Paraburkholderia bannensis TaxID=765414 RepID=A0A7W9U4I9_9BURK|nr:polyphosphate glucokinase [Paraburkholderia sp. WP4_3_2]MBB6106853.1 polyphosphate glucokinase [Paraburkholderia bannensis]